MLKENLENVEQKIQAACERSGRDRSEVTLIAVSKTKPAEMEIGRASCREECRSRWSPYH